MTFSGTSGLASTAIEPSRRILPSQYASTIDIPAASSVPDWHSWVVGSELGIHPKMWKGFVSSPFHCGHRFYLHLSPGNQGAKQFS